MVDSAPCFIGNQQHQDEPASHVGYLAQSDVRVKEEDCGEGPHALNGLSFQVASTSGASYAEVKHEPEEGAIARLAPSAHLSQPAYLSDHEYTLKRFPSWYNFEHETKPTASYSRVRRVRPLRKGLQSCDLCQRLFLRKNLFAHLRTVHWYSKEDVLKVKEDMRREVSMHMKKVYRSSKEGSAVQTSTGGGLDCSEQLNNRHFERSQLLRMTNTLKGLNTCEVCKKLMPSNDLYRHLEIVHKYSQERIAVVKDEIRREGIAVRNILPVMCPICEERFEGHDDLASHCSANHSKDGAGGEPQDYSLLSLRFSKIEEFEVWLEEQCERTVTSFYQHCRTGDTYYLRCHRSGKSVPKGKIRVSSTKKSVRNCTCHLNVYLNVDGSIAVKGCFGHVGHSLDAALLRITKPQETYLKTLLQEFSIDYVLRLCKREFPAKTSRMHHVVRHDLWNIIVRHGLNAKSEDKIVKPKCQPPEDEQDEDYGIPLLEMLADQSEDECVLDRSSPPHCLTPSSAVTRSESSSHPSSNPPTGEKQGSACGVDSSNHSGLEQAADHLSKAVPESARSEGVVQSEANTAASDGLMEVDDCQEVIAEAPEKVAQTDSAASQSSLVHGDCDRQAAPVPWDASERRNSVPEACQAAHDDDPIHIREHSYALRCRPSLFRRCPSRPPSIIAHVPSISSISKALHYCGLCRRTYHRVNLCIHLRAAQRCAAQKVQLAVGRLRSDFRGRRQISRAASDGNAVKGSRPVLQTKDASSSPLLKCKRLIQPGPAKDSTVAERCSTRPASCSTKPPEGLLLSNRLHACELCMKAMHENDLLIHLMAVHKYTAEQIERVKKGIRKETKVMKKYLPVVCPMCQCRFVDHEQLARHCETTHSEDGINGEAQDYTVQTFQFDSRAAYEVWLEEKCQKTISGFYQLYRSEDMYYLRCNRSGRAGNRDRAEKAVQNCSCYLDVCLHSDGAVTARGCFGHVGHTLNPAFLHITKLQEQYLKNLLEGHSIEHTIRLCRTLFPAKTSRLHHVNASDLWSIITRHGLSLIPNDGGK